MNQLFIQRSSKIRTKDRPKYEHLSMLLTSSEHEIINILPDNDEIYVSWLREETVTPSPQTNSVIAAWTMSQARLILYEYLEKLDSRVLYCNTDSCIYVSRGEPSEYEPCTGNFLDDMTDELENYGAIFRVVRVWGPEILHLRRSYIDVATRFVKLKE